LNQRKPGDYPGCIEIEGRAVSRKAAGNYVECSERRNDRDRRERSVLIDPAA
jgi:hypothetical protein